SFQLLHSLLQVLSYNDLKLGGGFERAFVALFDQDVQTFTGSTLLNLDQLENQLDKEEFQETRSMDAFRFFLAYTRTEVRQFRDTLIQHMKSIKKSIDERAHHKQDKTKSDQQDTSSKSGNDANIKDADIRLVNDQVPFVEFTSVGKENEKLHKKNEHLKQTDKDLYDSIKKTRVQTKDINDSLIAQVNITPHYLPKVREYVLAKPHHVIAPGSFKNSQEELYGSNDMAHNHYLKEARKKTQKRNRNSKPSVMHTTSLQNTTNGSKPNPRSNNQITRSLPVSKSSCGMSNGVLLKDKGFLPRSLPLYMRNQTLLDLVLGGNRQVEFSRLLVLSGYLLERCSSITQPKLTVNLQMVQMMSVYISSGLALQRQIAFADNTSGPGVQESVVSIGTPSSTRIDQDTPSTSTSQTTQEEQSYVIPTSVEKRMFMLWKLLNEDEACLTIKFNNFPKVQVKDLEVHDVSNDEENKTEAVFAEKQARYHQHPHHQPYKLMFKCVRPLAGKTFQKEFRSAGWCKENRDGQKTVAEDMGFNLLVHSFRALSTLRRSGLRTASAAAKPCQGDSSEVYLITGSIYTD
ncbi:hypothetical protein Tco_0280616, partial [Tanacetum coccineum]